MATNAEYWAEKVRHNREDAATDRLLREAGRLSVRIWEHEAPHEAAERIAAVVRSRRRSVVAP